MSLREMHKWKDKVELSLDNRQIFFLFFGLSTVGCLVFALGVMVGRRVNFELPTDRGSQRQELAVLDELAGLDEELSFPAALKPSDAEPMRDVAPSSVDPRAEAVPAPAVAPNKKSRPKATKPSERVVLSSSAAKPQSAAPESDAAGARQFTLQMKAFSQQSEAESLAQQLRDRGHQARVEPHEVKGRIWHRVRVGAFDTWAEGLAAKHEFEQTEKVIAYVVRM
jgi:cell division septation protein DedD